jgi:Tol biopolymer transport system component
MYLRQHRLRLGAVAIFALAAALTGAATAATGGTERISVSTGGGQANGASGVASWRPAISDDGNLVAFDSTATNLAPGATSGQDNVYLRSRSGSAIQLISATGTGGEANGPSSEPDLSGDGRYVAFHTNATNLVPGGPAAGIVVLDRVTHTITPVSVAGKKGVDGHDPSISDDGRYVAFESASPDLASGASGGKSGGGSSTGVAIAGTISSYVYVRDLVKQKTQLVSVNSAGKAAGPSFDPVISANGRYVAFDTGAPLVPDDTNGSPDVYVHDLQTGSIVRVSVDSSGRQGAGNYFAPSISGDGRYVAFDAATPLTADDTNGKQDVYVHDLVTGLTTRASVDTAGNQADGHSDNFSLGDVQDGRLGAAGPQISGDGRYVAFVSAASNLVAGDTNTCTSGDADFPAAGQCPDVFVHDLQTGVTTRVSVDGNGGQADGPSGGPAVDADGSTVAFLSAATDLVAGDTNDVPDVFVHTP